MLIGIGGKVLAAELEGLTLETGADGVPVLRVIPATPPPTQPPTTVPTAIPWQRADYVLGGTVSEFGIPSAFSDLLVYRNGLLMSPDNDYTVAGAIVRFVPTQSPIAGDIVILRWLPVPGEEPPPPKPPPSDASLSFPGAAGFGAMTPGGRGGRVIAVTNLNDSGPGSLRTALTTQGPRIVVFRVAGIIELASRINVGEPYLTVAGQTAPGGGITLRAAPGAGQMIHVNTHDVIIRFLRVRSGASGTPGSGQVNLQINSGAHDVIVDHCSMSWTLDENFNITRNIPEAEPEPTWPHIYNITLQRSLMAEGLIPHSTGVRVGGEFAKDGWRGVHHITIHHNLFAANNARNPSVGTTGMKVINNVVYQWGSELAATTAGAVVDWIGNYFQPGNLSALSGHFVHNAFDKYDPGIVYATPSLFMSGNLMVPGVRDWDLYTIHYSGDAIPPDFRRAQPLPVAPVPVPVETAESAYISVLEDVAANARVDCAGRLVPNLDAVDARVRLSVLNRTPSAAFVTTPSEVGGFPAINPGVACADADGDGMPDQWETAVGLNPALNDSAGFNLDSTYSNVEVYFNGGRPYGI
ncbi:MAG TPA: hypothetical protein VM223_11265 [Planctomycetota bacterium]|nr:hypothetical protein [Planctomycetota bacterium]